MKLYASITTDIWCAIVRGRLSFIVTSRLHFAGNWWFDAIELRLAKSEELA